MRLQGGSLLGWRTAGRAALGGLVVVGAAAIAGCGGGSNGSHSSSTFWGSTQAQLEFAPSTTTFTNHCGSVTLSQPVSDGHGGITMTGPFPSNTPQTDDTYTGQVSGNNMSLRVADSANNTLAVYQLTQGVRGRVVVGTCP